MLAMGRGSPCLLAMRAGLVGMDRWRQYNCTRRNGRVQVDLTATVSSALLEQITKAGGTVVSSFESAKAIRARIPLGQLEALAARADVIFISPAAQATTNQTEKSTNAPASGAGIRP